MKRLIVAGKVSNEARVFLLAHRVPITEHLNLSFILLDEDIAVLNLDEKTGEYVAGFWCDDGDGVEENCVIVEFNVDAYATCVSLRKDYWTSFVQKP